MREALVMGVTSIEWCDHSINPIKFRLALAVEAAKPVLVNLCTKCSPGCENCYAEGLTRRWWKEEWGPFPGYTAQALKLGEFVIDPSKLQEVLRRKKPTRYFWCDMTDMFHPSVPFELVSKCFSTMALTPQHVHMVLTKRPERMAKWSLDTEGMDLDYVSQLGLPPAQVERLCKLETSWRWPLPNVWLGTSCERQKEADERIPHLLRCPAVVRFISCEPLLSSLDLSKYFNEARREGISGPSGIGMVRGHGGRNHLEECGVSRGRGGSHALDFAAAGREKQVQQDRISTGHVSRPRPAAEDRCSSDCLDGGQQVGHPGPDGDQSQGRSEVEQPSRQPRARDATRERDSLHQGATQKTEGAAGGAERDGEDHVGTGGGDFGFVQGEGNDSAADSRKVRVDSERHILHCHSKELVTPSIAWVIVGGESGPGARPMDVAWARSIVGQCKAAGVSCFVKQLGAKPYGPGIGFRGMKSKELGMGNGFYRFLNDSKGGDIGEFPEDLRVREFPGAVPAMAEVRQ
jgi:protein gp37